MERDFAGYMVVRKPEQNFVDGERPSLIRSPTISGPILYSGVDRMPWFDLDEAHYAGTLTPELDLLWRSLSDRKPAGCDFRLTNEHHEALIALQFTGASTDKNEICVVARGSNPSDADTRTFDTPVRWLGVDVYVSGYGSVISEGIFPRPDLFADFVDRINPYGLFNSTDQIIHSLRARCTEIPQTENIEPMPENEELWQQILVGRIS